jgi:ribonuclease HI
MTRAMQILETVMQEQPDTEHVIHIYTDSEYTINCLEKWLPAWIANDWVKSDGKQVKNIDLLKVLSTHYFRNRRHYHIHHVRSHTGDQSQHSLGNQEADRLAVMASKCHPNYRK